MIEVIVRRVVITIPVLLLVSVVAFSLVLLIPGDPAITLAGQDPSPERIEQIRTNLGFDRSLVTQYTSWVTGAVQGDFGTSLLGGDVRTTIFERLPPTLSMALLAILISLLGGIPIGTISALRKGSRTDRWLGLFVAGSLSIPNYFLGMLLVLVFAIWSNVLPATAYVPLTEGFVPWLVHMLLPSVALASVGVGVVARQLRSSLIGVLGEDYIRTARAKGLRGEVVVTKHALKNAAIPVLSTLVGQIGAFIGGAVTLEKVFGINGLGSLAVNAVVQADMPMIQGIVVMAAVIVVVANLLADLALAYFNPKVRVS